MTHRNYGIPSALAAAMPADRPLARTTDPAVPVAGKIQSLPMQVAVDLLAFIFGIFFVFVCTVGLAAAISVLIYYSVI